MTKVARYISGKELAKVIANMSETENTEGSSKDPQSKPVSSEKLSKSSNQSLFSKEHIEKRLNFKSNFKEEHVDLLDENDFCTLCQAIIFEQSLMDDVY